MNSICKFVPPARAEATINTINFVYESRAEKMPDSKMSSVYRIHYVVQGSGMVECGGVTKAVKKGDIFFAFPAVSYAISGDADFEYMYISFIGIRANAELERLGISRHNFVFADFEEVYDFWRECISLSSEIVDLISESVLLYTLSKIADRFLACGREESSVSAANVGLIKNYIDDNFADPELSLDKISRHFSYHKKYISTLFKKHFKVGLLEYIHTVRINHACKLIEENHTNVSEIALACGFSDALYFSKVFKKQIGRAPKKYMIERQAK